MPSNNELLAIKDTSETPQKVIVEGDTLSIGTTIHSFYWPFDIVVKRHDYEPVAKYSNDCFLTRYHYRWLVIWYDFLLQDSVPIVEFADYGHTPFLCTEYKPIYVKPIKALDRVYLAYFLRKMKTALHKKDQKNYRSYEYANKIVDEKVPEKSKFAWDGLQYLIIVSSVKNPLNLPISAEFKAKILDLLKNRSFVDDQ
jgi:hypothetical protein